MGQTHTAPTRSQTLMGKEGQRRISKKAIAFLVGLVLFCTQYVRLFHQVVHGDSKSLLPQDLVIPPHEVSHAFVSTQDGDPVQFINRNSRKPDTTNSKLENVRAEATKSAPSQGTFLQPEMNSSVFAELEPIDVGSEPSIQAAHPAEDSNTDLATKSNQSLFMRFSAFPTHHELQSNCPPRLEFLHIPKSGGTAIEQVATQQANIAWGSCHFHLNYKKPWTNLCPPFLNINPVLWPKHEKLNDLWHYPLDWLERNRTLTYHPMPSNPYNNMALPATAAHSQVAVDPTSTQCPPDQQPVHFFAVVRDPYKRAISEFYFQAGFATKKTKKKPDNRGDKKMQDPTFLNGWINRKIQEYENLKEILSTDNITSRKGWNGKMLHWVPQSEYIFDTNGVRRVHHILKYENLQDEFHQLMEAYGLSLVLPPAPHSTNTTTFINSTRGTSKSGRIMASDRMTVLNLTDTLRVRLQRHFAGDFKLGDYPSY